MGREEPLAQADGGRGHLDQLIGGDELDRGLQGQDAVAVVQDLAAYGQAGLELGRVGDGDGPGGRRCCGDRASGRYGRDQLTAGLKPGS